MRSMLVLKVVALSGLACGIVFLWAAITSSYWMLSSLIAFESHEGRALIIDIPVLAVVSVLAIVVLIAVGKRIAANLKGFARRVESSL